MLSDLIATVYQQLPQRLPPPHAPLPSHPFKAHKHFQCSVQEHGLSHGSNTFDWQDFSYAIILTPKHGRQLI
jgi:hypothetical protein